MGKRGRSRNRRGLTRREFITGTAAAAGLALAGCGDGRSTDATTRRRQLPKPEKSGIDHVVVVMMENRSFDHFLGWVPGADGIQAGVTLLDRDGNPHHSYDLAPNFQNCHLADPDHGYDGGRVHVNDGRMDGFLLTSVPGDTFPIGYYTAASLPFFKGCADHWTICDRYFSGILSYTTPNRFYMHAGQTDRLTNTVDISTLPTVWDRMLEVGRSVQYYYTDVSYTSFWGDKYLGFSRKYDRDSFATELAGKPLANLTFIDNVGNTMNEQGGISIDDHPYADIRDGQAFLNDVYDALRRHPDWPRTLLIINYDEWGGFYDHVPPPFAAVSPEEAALGNDGRLGCRVPCVLIGPRARRGHVESMQLDPNSILNMLAWRFGFAPLGVRTGSSNLALALDFSGPPDVSAPAFEVAPGPFGGACVPIQALNYYSNPARSPVPAPSWPLDPVPLPAEVQLPSIPGFDVPVPTPAQLMHLLEESALRRAGHEAELQALRDFGANFGF